MKSEVQLCQPTVEPVVATTCFFFPKHFQLSNILQKDLTLEIPKCHLHISPSGDEVVILAAM